MLHHESAGRPYAGVRALGSVSSPIDALAYRSRARCAPTISELGELLRTAQQRNRTEGVSGLLIYDRGFFYQWLEGPKRGLQRIWNSIRRDGRHTEIKILREQSLPKRFFNGWDMRLALQTRGDLDRTLVEMAAPHELFTKLRMPPAVLAMSTWDRVFSNAVLPALHPEVARGDAAQRRYAPPDARAAGSAAIWHAERSAGAELAERLQEPDPRQTVHFIDSLIDQGAGLEPLFNEVFEPAARWLGGLWDDDRCDDFHVSLALGRLQLEVRRVGHSLLGSDQPIHPGHAVLVALQPGEVHALNATMNSELFLRDGWDVSYQNPKSDNVLRDILHKQWFDVLDLSLSGALRRDQQLRAMRHTIRSARAASLNPALAVIVDGRSFVDHPDAYRDVGADVGCLSSMDTVPAANEWLRVHELATLADPKVPQYVKFNLGH